MWRRFAGVLNRSQGRLLLRPAPGFGNRGAQTRAFGRLLGGFVRGRVHLHFGSCRAQARSGTAVSARQGSLPRAAGEAGGVIDRKGASLVKVIQAGTRHRHGQSRSSRERRATPR